VDGVRLPKEAYYVCQAMFRDDPQVHIIGHWNYPAGTKKTIHVVSNCGAVELFVNGQSAGQGINSNHFLFTFNDIQFKPGEIKAVAFYGGQAVATNSIRTAGDPVALRLTPITGPRGLQADGSDVALIDAEAVDADGWRCPTFQKQVDFSCAGPAIWRGGYNSGKPGSINGLSLDLESGINRVAVRSLRQPGTITVSAKCDGLKSATVSILSLPVNLKDGGETALPPLPVATLKHLDFLHVNVEPAGVNPGLSKPLFAGRYIVSFSYSGPTALVHVEQNAADGKKTFVDRDLSFSGLPTDLIGADWVQGADNDSTYSAVDLMQVAVKGGCIVAVAHDNRLPAPAWLERQFQHTEMRLKVDGQTMTVFQHRALSDESLTLGSNTEDPGIKNATAYIVFVNGLAAVQSRSDLGK